jgi:membrane-associated protease RseP (regulator of RpoE activity)
MLKTVLFVVLGAAVGFAVASWRQPESAPPPGTAPLDTARGASSGDDARLAALERALAAEADERAALEARVVALATELEALQAAVPRGTAPERDTADAPSAAAEPAQPQRQGFARGGGQRQLERLIAAGFSPDRAEWIDRRTQELRMQALQAQYDAQRDGRPLEAGTLLAGERTLRAELGEAEYERYLEAVGRPTSVGVQGLLASSPAERAGLKSGDQIVSYAGQRVFELRELNALTLEGTAGESVVVEVRRDGQTLQLVMPRGPIGIFGGGFRGPPGR